MRKELDEFRAARRLDTQRLLAVHTWDVEQLIESRTERVSRIVEPFMDVVADKNNRGHDEVTLQVKQIVDQVAGLTTRLAAVEVASSSSRMAAAETAAHEVGQIQREIAMTIAQALAPPPLAPDAVAGYDRSADPAKALAYDPTVWALCWAVPLDFGCLGVLADDIGAAELVRRHGGHDASFPRHGECGRPSPQRAEAQVALLRWLAVERGTRRISVRLGLVAGRAAGARRGS